MDAFYKNKKMEKNYFGFVYIFHYSLTEIKNVMVIMSKK